MVLMTSRAIGSRTSLNLGAGLVVARCSLAELVGAQKEEPSPCDIKRMREDEKSFGVLEKTPGSAMDSQADK